MVSQVPGDTWAAVLILPGVAIWAGQSRHTVYLLARPQAKLHSKRKLVLKLLCDFSWARRGQF